jgi:hypothetical protein
VRESLKRVLVLLLEFLETKNSDFLDEIFDWLLYFLVSADELKPRVEWLSSLYIIFEFSEAYKADDQAMNISLSSWYRPIIIK